MKTKQFFDPLRKLFEESADASNAQFMKAYLKDQFEMLGIKTPKRKELYKIFFKEHGKPEAKDLPEALINLWEEPFREYQYFAMRLAEKYFKNPMENMIGVYEEMVLSKSWWDTVDLIAAKMMGNYFRYYPEKIREYVDKWQASGNMWLRRCAILFQLKYKKETDVSLLFEIIKLNADSSEFFIRKAIGWSLREYSKTDPDAVVNFVKNNELKPLSEREALKWLNRKK